MNMLRTVNPIFNPCYRTATLAIVLLFFAASCSKNSLDSSLINRDANEDTNYSVSIDDVYDLYRQSPTRSNDLKVEPVITKNDTTLYIVNFDDGWEILSSDKRAPRIFAKCDTGSLKVSDLTSIPALALLYEHFTDNISLLKANPDIQVDDVFLESWDSHTLSQQTASLSSPKMMLSNSYETVKSHLLKTKWGQGHPWNIRAPYTSESLAQHCLTGCGPVAMAQFLYYLNSTVGVQYIPYEDCFTYKYIPDGSSYIQLNSSDVTFISSSGSPLSVWNSMPLDSLSLNQSFEAVSTLMIDMGRIAKSEYYIDATSTYSNYLFSSFVSSLHMTILSGDVDFDYLSASIISHNLPAILLIGHRDSLNRWSNGHYVVADAMKEYYQDGELTGRYIGFNWGWDGYCDNLWLNTDIINWNVNYTNFNSIYYMVFAPILDYMYDL